MKLIINKIIILILIGYTLTASGQEAIDSTQVHQKNFSVGIYFSPNLTYRTSGDQKNYFTYTINPDFGSGAIAYDKKFDKSGFNYGYGVLFNTNLNKNFSVDFGLLNQVVSYKTGIVDTVIVSWTYDQGGSTDTILNDVSFRFIYKSMSIPFSVLYVIKRTNKIAFCFGAGVSVNFITNKEVTRNIVSSGNSRIYLMDYDAKEKLLNGFIKTKLSYLLSKRIEIATEPQFQYMVNSLKSGKRLYSFILNMGVNVKI